MADIGTPDKTVYPQEEEYEQEELIPVEIPKRKEEAIPVPNWPQRKEVPTER